MTRAAHAHHNALEAEPIGALRLLFWLRLGADDYLAKPVTAVAVAEALQRTGSAATETPTPMSPRRLEWEHMQRVRVEHGGNLSATARALNMHRRTLQRELAKRPASG